MKALRPRRIFLLTSVSVLTLALAGKVFEDLKGPRYRAEYVARTVADFVDLERGRPPIPEAGGDGGLAPGAGADEILAWTVRSALRGAPPAEMELRLARAEAEGKLPRRTRELSDTIRRQLRRWSETEKASSDPLPLARGLFYESNAQSWGGREDTTVIRVWAALRLAAFIREKPFDSDVPEALALMAEIFLKLRPLLRDPKDADLLLHLCADQYAGSVWGIRARMLWQQELSAREPVEPR